jgi:hypothetical protein
VDKTDNEKEEMSRQISRQITRDELKDVFKQAMKEWLNDKFTEFGKWSFAAIAAAGFSALFYFIFWVEFKK